MSEESSNRGTLIREVRHELSMTALKLESHLHRPGAGAWDRNDWRIADAWDSIWSAIYELDEMVDL